MLDDCACMLSDFDITYPSLVEGESHGMLLLSKVDKKIIHQSVIPRVSQTHTSVRKKLFFPY